MSHRLGSAITAALLIVVAGCSADTFVLTWPGSGGKPKIVSGSIEDTAAHLRASLSKLNIVVAVNPMDEGTIELNGLTKTGRRFALVLKRHKTNRGENTAITVEWEKDADEQFWATVLDLLVKPAPIGNGAPISADGVNSGR